MTERKCEWFDGKCDIIIKKKKEARKKWIRTGNENEYDAYKRIRKEGARMMKRKKQNNRMDNEER